jgi:hypothetical protein
MIALAAPTLDDLEDMHTRVVDLHPIEVKRRLLAYVHNTRSYLVTAQRADGTINTSRVYARSEQDAGILVMAAEESKGYRVRSWRVRAC